jgi:hypothetical protein
VSADPDPSWRPGAPPDQPSGTTGRRQASWLRTGPKRLPSGRKLRGSADPRSWQPDRLVAESYVCSSRRMALGGLPDWWTYPTCCANGHGWRPGRVIVSWMPCLCAPAREAQEKGPGHRVIACRAPGCGFEVYQPPHDQATAGLAQHCTYTAGCGPPTGRATPPRSAKQAIRAR